VHVSGTGGWVRPDAVPAVDVAAIVARCRPSSDPANDVFREGGRVSMLTFGPRWAALRDVHTGVGEEVALLEVPAAAAGDLDRWGLHPALFDVATSFGGHGEGSYLPLSYGRVVVHHPLPARFHSHLRLSCAASNGATPDRATADGDVIAADVTLVAEDGTVLVSVEDFVLRRVDVAAVTADVAAVAAVSTDRPAQATASPAARRQRGVDDRGMAPADGAEAFRRAVATDLGPQLMINTETVAELLVRARSPIAEPDLDLDVGLGADAGGAAGGVVGADDGKGFTAPRTDLEATLATVWAQTLGVDRVGVDDDFFELGGNSLVAVQLVSQIRKAVGVRLPMRSLFETPTIGGLAVRVEQLREAAPPVPDTAPAQPEPVAATRTITRLSRD